MEFCQAMASLKLFKSRCYIPDAKLQNCLNAQCVQLEIKEPVKPSLIIIVIPYPCMAMGTMYVYGDI